MDLNLHQVSQNTHGTRNTLAWFTQVIVEYVVSFGYLNKDAIPRILCFAHNFGSKVIELERLEVMEVW